LETNRRFVVPSLASFQQQYIAFFGS